MIKRTVLTIATLAALPLMWASLASAETPMAGKEAPDPIGWHKAMCTERFAHDSARLAYLEAKLNLTDKQKPAWQNWVQAKSQATQQERDACLSATPKTDAKPTALDREAMVEKDLTVRLQGLQAARPAFQVLYDQLNADQRAILDRPHGHHGFAGQEGHEGSEGHHPQ